ncbi:hypothetical protein Tco_0185452 [Tanacetum coccineum]
MNSEHQSDTFTIHSDDGNPFRVNIKQLYSRYKRWCSNLILADSDSLPHAHAQTTKTYYKHQDLRIKKAQELKIKTSANSDIKDPSLETASREIIRELLRICKV